MEGIKIVDSDVVKKSSKATTSTVMEDNSLEKEVIPITYREMKRLRGNGYEKIKDKFTKSFVLRNKKTNQIVELSASTAAHACNLIGWRNRFVEVIETKDKSEKQ